MRSGHQRPQGRQQRYQQRGRKRGRGETQIRWRTADCGSHRCNLPHDALGEVVIQRRGLKQRQSGQEILVGVQQAAALATLLRVPPEGGLAV
jgi:hypothetical protein